MHPLKLRIIAFFLSISSIATAQLETSFMMMPDSSGWGVYLRPIADDSISSNVVLISGQITFIVSSGYPIDITSVNGVWSSNARVDSPIENPNNDYVSIGLIDQTFPDSGFHLTQEVLLFTFPMAANCPDELYIMGNDDPFAAPNSVGNNPENNLPLLDRGTGDLINWEGNYDLCPDYCVPCDPNAQLTTVSQLTKNKITVYPNPTSGLISLKGETTDIVKVTVLNAVGKRITQIATESNQLDFSFLENGIYYLILENDKGTIKTEKLLIQS